MATGAFPRIRAAAVDERAHNVHYRQAQLKRLFDALVANVDALREAIAADYGLSQSETAVECSLAVAAVRRDHAALQPENAREDEYSIANGRTAGSARRPAGVVVIEPIMHTLLYSIVVPLSAAMAAGNCVIVILENNLRATSSIIRQLLLAALDADTFAITSSPITDPIITDRAIVVNQNGTARWPTANHLSSPTRARAVAIVDRTADVQQAAQELVAARFSFGGRSPYAPDIVLVNEFVKSAFLEAVISESFKLGTDASPRGSARSKHASAGEAEKAVDLLREAVSDLRVVVNDGKCAVVELVSRKLEIIARKMKTPVLIVHAYRSLDDAIDLLAKTSDGPNLAAFHFSNAKSAKYLTQFVDSRVSFVNHIPRELLVGPAYPAAHPINLDVRYPTELFEVYRPALVQPLSTSATIAAALAGGDSAAVGTLLAAATTPLAVAKRKEIRLIGFFEQGFLLNAGMIFGSVVASVAGSSLYFVLRHRRSVL